MRITTMTDDTVATLRLLQLASPALPLGAYAFSQGLESAVEAGWVSDEASLHRWVLGVLENNLGALDVPLLARLQDAWQRGDDAGVMRWRDFLLAARGSRELQDEERRLGAALARALDTLGVPDVRSWIDDARTSHVVMYARACAHWGLDGRTAAAAFLFAWCENQVAAALRLLSVGQSAGLRLLAAARTIIPAVVQAGSMLPDHALAFGAPGLALGSAQHETQYSRIFRS